MDSDIAKFLGVMLSIALAGGLGYTLIAIGGVVARRIEGRSGISEEELEGLRDQGRELAELHERVTEMEERLDFAERLLAQRKEAAQLGERGSRDA